MALGSAFSNTISFGPHILLLFRSSTRARCFSSIYLTLDLPCHWFHSIHSISHSFLSILSIHSYHIQANSSNSLHSNSSSINFNSILIIFHPILIILHPIHIILPFSSYQHHSSILIHIYSSIHHKIKKSKKYHYAINPNSINPIS